MKDRHNCTTDAQSYDRSAAYGCGAGDACIAGAGAACADVLGTGCGLLGVGAAVGWFDGAGRAALGGCLLGAALLGAAGRPGVGMLGAAFCGAGALLGAAGARLLGSSFSTKCASRRSELPTFRNSVVGFIQTVLGS